MVLVDLAIMTTTDMLRCEVPVRRETRILEWWFRGCDDRAKSKDWGRGIEYHGLSLHFSSHAIGLVAASPVQRGRRDMSLGHRRYTRVYTAIGFLGGSSCRIPRRLTFLVGSLPSAL